jgi:DNA helicase II / ATP-dependent DNA helicase PcrA
LRIISCAGSGKTEVIAQRVVKLLDRRDVQPRNIVAFTFTEKAVGELKQRITARVREQLVEVRGMAELFVGTMHAYALSMLQSQVPETFKCTVLSEVQARVLLDRFSKRSGLTDTLIRTKGKAPRPMQPYKNSRLYQQALAVVREDEVDPALLPPDVAAGLNSYRKLLAHLRYLDCSEILRLAADLLLPGTREESEPVLSLRAHVKEKVRYVVVDEYQDTDPVQEQLIAELVQFGANLCVRQPAGPGRLPRPVGGPPGRRRPSGPLRPSPPWGTAPCHRRVPHPPHPGDRRVKRALPDTDTVKAAIDAVLAEAAARGRRSRQARLQEIGGARYSSA